MMPEFQGGHDSVFSRREHDPAALAKKTLLLGFDGTGFPKISTDAQGVLNVRDLSGSSSTEFPEDGPHSSGDLGSLLLAVRNDAITSKTDADGDYSPISVDAQGRVIVDGSSKTQPVSGSVSISSLPAVDTELPAPAALDDTAPNPSTPAVGAFSMLWTGSVWLRAPGTLDGARIQGAGSVGSVPAGDPLFLAFVSGSSLPATGSEGTLSGAASDLRGRLLTADQAPGEPLAASLSTTSTTAVAVITGTAGKKIRILSFALTNAGLVGGDVTLSSNIQSTTDLQKIFYLAQCGGGLTRIFRKGWVLDVGEDLRIKVTASMDVRVEVEYTLV